MRFNKRKDQASIGKIFGVNILTMVVFNISCFVYSRQGAFRGSGNARLRGRAECFRAVFGYKPAGAPYPPFPLKKTRKKRNKRRRKPRKRAKKT